MNTIAGIVTTFVILVLLFVGTAVLAGVWLNLMLLWAGL
jgi:hypothetical protein